MKGKTTTLYHFTCDHGHRAISASGILLPHVHPFMRELGPLLWLTDLGNPPDRDSLGLNSRITTCDRMAYRYIVQARCAISWSTLRAKAPAQVLVAMEAFGMPEHWWVARRPLTASEFRLDRAWRGSAA